MDCNLLLLPHAVSHHGSNLKKEVLGRATRLQHDYRDRQYSCLFFSFCFSLKYKALECHANGLTLGNER